MTTSHRTPSLSKPEGDARIPVGTLGYFAARNRNQVYDLVMREFQNSHISQATPRGGLEKLRTLSADGLGLLETGHWTQSANCFSEFLAKNQLMQLPIRSMFL